VDGPSPERVRAWADRRTGVGFDSLLLVQEASADGAVARYRVINADGFDAEQCGNGARCIATYLAATAGESLLLESAAGDIEARVLGAGMASVNLGEPRFAPADVPFVADEAALRYRLNLSCGEVEFGIASMGNPHAVIVVDSVDTAAVGILGPEMGRHPRFPEGVNVGFMEVRDAATIRLRVFERGVGETRACGTGAAAAVAIGRRWELLGSRVAVELPGGTLRVEWQGPGTDLWQTGPTTKVYEGRIDI
jgi:diaminopimelate epimerase